jgi:hypothetical protein
LINGKNNDRKTEINGVKTKRSYREKNNNIKKYWIYWWKNQLNEVDRNLEKRMKERDTECFMDLGKLNLLMVN